TFLSFPVLAVVPPLPSSLTLGLLRVREKSTFSESQRTTLEKAYQCKPYVDYQRRMELAMNIGLSEEQVRIWFQNRRAKDRQVAKRRTEPTDRLYSPKAASSSGTPWWTNSSPK
ncbi:homeobox protein CDX-4-like, partial [Amblyomma americanum]